MSVLGSGGVKQEEGRGLEGAKLGWIDGVVLSEALAVADQLDEEKDSGREGGRERKLPKAMAFEGQLSVLTD